MAYLGSTQATSLANPPVCINPGVIARGNPGSTALSTAIPSDGSRSAYATQGGATWRYVSSHGSTEVCDTAFFSDAWYIGIRPGDRLEGLQWTTAGSSLVSYSGYFASVSTAGANLTTGGIITSTFA